MEDGELEMVQLDAEHYDEDLEPYLRERGHDGMYSDAQHKREQIEDVVNILDVEEFSRKWFMERDDT